MKKEIVIKGQLLEILLKHVSPETLNNEDTYLFTLDTSKENFKKKIKDIVSDFENNGVKKEDYGPDDSEYTIDFYKWKTKEVEEMVAIHYTDEIEIAYECMSNKSFSRFYIELACNH